MLRDVVVRFRLCDGDRGSASREGDGVFGSCLLKEL